MSMFYPKINGVYKRYTEGPKKHRMMVGDFSCPEYGVLQDVVWKWSEKQDGANAGVHFGKTGAVLLGRTMRTVMSDTMIRVLTEWYDQHTDFHETELTIYGELVGPKIQKNLHQLPAVEFRPFDVKYHHQWWAKERVVNEIPGALPMWETTLRDMLEAFADHYAEHTRNGAYLEGWVGTPDVCTLKGERIITKVKAVDLLS